MPRPELEDVDEHARSMLALVTNSIDLDSELAEQLGRLFGWSRVQFYELLAKRTGLQIEVSSMSMLGALTRSGPIRTSDLALDMGLDASTVSRQLAKMIEKGWVRRSIDPTDGRAALVSLTPSGKRLRERLWAQWRQALQEATADWTVDEREQFRSLIARLHDALSKTSASRRPMRARARRVETRTRAGSG